MGWWTDLRDTVESAAVVAGNYFVPGSSLITSKLTSEGSQKQLNSSLGKLAQLGSGLSGAGVGSEYTGIPASGGYNSLSEMFSSNPSSAMGYENGADIGGAGSSPANMGSDVAAATAPTAAATPPAFTPSTVAQGSNIPAYGTAGGEGNYGYDMGTGTAGPASVPTNPYAPDNIDVGGGFNPATGYVAPKGFLASMGAGNFGDAGGAVVDWAGKNPIQAMYVGGSLYDMYAKNQMAKQQKALYEQNRNDILNMYAPGSPEYNLLKQEMDRKDAAAGRNSQYGTRANEFAGQIAKYKTNALSGLGSSQNALYNTSLGNQYGMMNTPLTLAALTATTK